MEFKFIDGSTGSSDSFNYGPQTFYEGTTDNDPSTLMALHGAISWQAGADWTDSQYEGAWNSSLNKTYN